MTEEQDLNYWGVPVEEQTEHEHDYEVPSETGPSLDEWTSQADAPVEPEEVDAPDWDSLSITERQALIGVPQTGVWGDRSRAAYEKWRAK